MPIQIRELPITIHPNQPFWFRDGVWWRICGYAQPGNQAVSTCPWNPFEAIAAVLVWLRWQAPAHRRLAHRRRQCQREGHASVIQSYQTECGTYTSSECSRCETFLGYYRPDLSRVTGSWCDEGHVMNSAFMLTAGGRQCLSCHNIIGSE